MTTETSDCVFEDYDEMESYDELDWYKEYGYCEYMWDKYSYDDEHTDSRYIFEEGYYFGDVLYDDMSFIHTLSRMDMSVKEVKKCIDDRYYQCESVSCYTRKKDSVTDVEREQCGGVDYC